MRRRSVRTRGGVLLLALGLGVALSRPAPARAEDGSTVPARDLAARLHEQVRGALAGTGIAVRSIAVPPTEDRTGRLPRAAREIRNHLLLNLTRLGPVRVLPVEDASSAAGGHVLATHLDAVGRSVCLSALLSAPDGSGPVALLVAVEVEGDLVDGGEEGALGEVRFELVLAGRIREPVGAATAVALEDGAADALVLVQPLVTRVLRLAGYSFREVAATPHPLPTVPAPRSRDPRPGVALVPAAAGPGGPAELWVRPELDGAGYAWSPGGLGLRPLAEARDVPLGATGAGVLVGRLDGAGNTFASLGIVDGPFDPEPEPAGLATPALEATAGEGWVAVEAPSGEVTLHGPARSGPGSPAGRFGSALAFVRGPRAQEVFFVGDREQGRRLVVLRPAATGAREVWSEPVPFAVCHLVPGDFNGDGRDELALVGCGPHPRLGLLSPEGGP